MFQTSEKSAEAISNGDDWTKTNEYRKLWSRIYPKVLAECLRGSGRNNRFFRHENSFYELSWLLLLPRVSLQYFHKYKMLFSTLAKITVMRETDITYLLYTTVYETFTCSMCYKIYEHFRKHLLTQQHSGNSSHIGERRKPGTAEHDGSRLWTELQMVPRSLDSALAKHQTSVSWLQYFFS